MHIKAGANRNKTVEAEISVEAKQSVKELMQEVNADRGKHGKAPFVEDENGPKPWDSSRNILKKKLARRKKEYKRAKKAKKSTTDPDCGCS